MRWTGPRGVAPPRAARGELDGSGVHNGLELLQRIVAPQIFRRRSTSAMVLLHVKRSDKDTFLFDTPAATEVDAGSARSPRSTTCGKDGRLAAQVEGLAAHGLMRCRSSRASTTRRRSSRTTTSRSTTKARALPETRRALLPRPAGGRTGNAPSPELAAVPTDGGGREGARPERQVQMKVATTQKALADAVGNIRGAVMIAYPMASRLRRRPPTWRSARRSTAPRGSRSWRSRRRRSGASTRAAAREIAVRVRAIRRAFPPRAIRRAQFSERCTAVTTGTRARTRRPRWWRSCRRRGRARRSAGRLPPTAKAMIAFYHKKQQEAEALALEDEDAYMNSSWANLEGAEVGVHRVGDVKGEARNT